MRSLGGVRFLGMEGTCFLIVWGFFSSGLAFWLFGILIFFTVLRGSALPFGREAVVLVVLG